MRRGIVSLVVLFAAMPALPNNARLRDIASVEGMRDNQLIGYGLVVGLAGTGDRRQTVFSAQSLTNMLERMGVSVPPTAIRVMNTAAVMVTGTLPALSRPGNSVDVTVSAIGDAMSLQGGVLLLTSMRGVDGQVYAVAQGPLVLGGYSASALGSSKAVNHPTVGRVPNGATVERSAPTPAPGPQLRWQLHRADFTTATRIAGVINKSFAPRTVAQAETGGSVLVSVPPEYKGREVQFIAAMESLPVDVESPARVVVNERTGTIVIGKDVAISPASILHGALSVEIQTSYLVSQPAPLSGGTTEIVPQVKVSVGEERAKSVVLPAGATVENLVKALGSIGATARDIIAILQNLKTAGALNAELEVI